MESLEYSEGKLIDIKTCTIYNKKNNEATYYRNKTNFN